MNQKIKSFEETFECLDKVVKNEIQNQIFAYVADMETYELLYVNSNSIIDINIDNWKNKKCYELIHNRISPCPFCNQHKLKKDSFYIWEHKNDKFNKAFLIKNKLIEFNEKTLLLGIANDISYKECLDIHLTEKLREEETIVECAKILMECKSDINKSINEVLKIVGQFYNSDRVYIFKLNKHKNSFENIYEWCNNKITPLKNEFCFIDINKHKGFADYFSKKKNMVIHNIEEISEKYPSEYNLLKSQNINSLIIIPCSYENLLTGFIGLDNPKDKNFDTELIVSVKFFIMNEITKHNLRSNLEYMNYYDDLTGLFNRKKYVKFLKDYDEEKINSIGISIADINGLKIINENYGHDSGNSYIKKTSDIILTIFKDSYIFRLNADEFMIIEIDVSFDDFIKKVNDLKSLFDKEENYSVSIGLSWSNYEKDINKLINQAEISMLIEKQDYYKNNSSNKIHKKPIILKELLQSLKENTFLIYLQPKIDLKTRNVSGAEALVRIYDKENDSIIGPNKFIELFEREKIIKYVDLFVFEEVCKLLSQWKKQNKKNMFISLNFSRLTLLENDLVNNLKKIISKYQCNIENIEIEITESLGDVEIEYMKYVINKLKNAGFKISLDDFGSKYTNTSVLSVFEFDILKLDRSLINNICCNKKSSVVVQSIIDLCKKLNVEVVAEGVENEIQFKMLDEMQCNIIQGYYFSKPISVETFEQKYLI